MQLSLKGWENVFLEFGSEMFNTSRLRYESNLTWWQFICFSCSKARASCEPPIQIIFDNALLLTAVIMFRWTRHAPMTIKVFSDNRRKWEMLWTSDYVKKKKTHRNNVVNFFCFVSDFQCAWQKLPSIIELFRFHWNTPKPSGWYSGGYSSRRTASYSLRLPPCTSYGVVRWVGTNCRHGGQ